MKNYLRYSIFISCLLLMGCSCEKQKSLNKRISLWRMDKIPYGTQYAFDNLPFIFPHAVIHSTREYPYFFQNAGADDTIRTVMIIGLKFAADSDQMNSIIRFASFGNQVFISALNYDDTVLNMLHLKWKKEMLYEEDSAEISLLNPATHAFEVYLYPGYTSHSYFESIDTGFAMILGRNHEGNPDFVRIPYPDGGAIYIHLNPFAFSNFFLLHNKNKSYYDHALSFMPAKTGVVEWCDFYRYSRPVNFSALHFILGSRSLRWAFWLTLLLFGMFFLIESKRNQRPIAEIPPLRNASEDFVKTVGRLYFQQKNNQNLAIKMIAAFLEHIRSTYNLSTSVLNDEFSHKLAFRTGRPVNEVMQMVHFIHEVRLKPDISDPELMDLHQQINQFNKPV